VMIKASADGGGKGMRIAYSSDEVAEGFDRATSEAASPLRRQPRLRREVHHRSAPHRDPGARRQARPSRRHGPGDGVGHRHSPEFKQRPRDCHMDDLSFQLVRRERHDLYGGAASCALDCEVGIDTVASTLLCPKTTAMHLAEAYKLRHFPAHPTLCETAR
jgi:carbamoyl-phosphate synthase L subunit-like protein